MSTLVIESAQIKHLVTKIAVATKQPIYHTLSNREGWKNCHHLFTRVTGLVVCGSQIDHQKWLLNGTVLNQLHYYL